MPEKLTNRVFHGKLLLFGEYSVLNGSKALVVPFPSVTARLDFSHTNPENSFSGESNATLRKFAGFLGETGHKISGLPRINIAGFKHDIEKGLFLRSSIPVQYGLGSSGALCAAVYHEYGPGVNISAKPLDLDEIQKVRVFLATMESYFHGQSSGIDPLCIYYDSSFLVEDNNMAKPFTLNPFIKQEIQIFLIDTGFTANTKVLVKEFGRKLDKQGMRETFMKQYIPYVNEMVDQFTSGMLSFESIRQLSVFQWNLFRDMIPGNYHPVWQFGLDSEYYACKLCGSGGGGYITGFTEDFEKASARLAERFNIKPVKLEAGS